MRVNIPADNLTEGEQELRRMAEEATEGPWETAFKSQTGIVSYHRIPGLIAQCYKTDKVNAAYIVAACNAVPDLLAEISSLRERLANRATDPA